MAAETDLDVAIIGGGPAGLTLGRMLAAAGLKTSVFEARSAGASATDGRALALSWRSHLTLARLGTTVPSLPGVAPIDAIHISHAGHPGRTLLRAAETGVPSFGFVVGYGALVGALQSDVPEGLFVEHDAPVVAINDAGTSITLRHARGLVRAAVAVIADGAGALLDELGFRATAREYGTHALVGTVRVSEPVPGLAFERFTAHGPLALLPCQDGHALVWTLPPDEARRMQSAPESAVRTALQDAFGWRLGRVVGVEARAAFPLALRQTRPATLGRVAAVGNAAQTLHPVAGQGFNLALRDVTVLASDLVAHRHDLAGALGGYGRERAGDRTRTIGFTHALAEGFTVGGAPAAWLRGGVLAALDLAPPARRTFAHLLSTTPLP
jgi:2-octaprenyl-6-methoxyphenol hydroxylase